MAKDTLSDEDKALFRQAVKTLGTLDEKQLAQKKSDMAASRTSGSGSAVFLSDFYAEPVASEAAISYQKQPLPVKRFKEFQNGQIRYQAKLDLHHMTIDKARDALLSFIVQQYELKHRCVIIVHGKGSHHGEAPVLKNLTNVWLKQIPEVIAFHSAHPKDGGAGAVYVLLGKR